MVGVCRAGTVTAHFSAASDVIITAPDFSATGDELEISLGFAPDTGTSLTVVRNQGGNPIEGEFSNLQQGQRVDLPFNGLIYKFTADYRGGSGNDLVLQWGYQHACLWGQNASGEFPGGGYEVGFYGSPVEVDRSGLLAGKTVRQVASNITSSHRNRVALCTDGALVCWTSDSEEAFQKEYEGALAGKKVISVSAGGSHTAVLCEGGTVVTWGLNDKGQLGDGSSTYHTTIPVQVDITGVLAGKEVIAVSAGTRHTLALCSDGTLVSWGDNGDGQLGVDEHFSSNVPLVVSGGGLAGRTVTAIAAGLSHSLALCSDGKMVAWGSGYTGRSGGGSGHVPGLVDDSGAFSGKSAVAISAGEYHNLALCSDNTVVSWGFNGSGQLGDNTTTVRDTPVTVAAAGALSGKTIQSVEAAGAGSFAVCSGGTVAAWGYNGEGQLGTGNSSHSPVMVPQAVSTSGVLSGAKVLSIESSGENCLALVALPLSHDASLADLQLDGGVMGHGFSSDRRNYLAAVAAGTTHVTVTLAVRHPLAKATVNGVPLPSGAESSPIPVLPGSTMVTVAVTAEDGSVGTYEIVFVNSGDVVASFDSEDDIPVVAGVVIATGRSVDLSLGFTPTVGSRLMLIDNAGLSPTQGEFTNLPHGGTIALPAGGLLFHYVANYHGGDGNDLVLEWRRRSVAAWGMNSSGQLGNGTTVLSRVPVPVSQSGVLAGKTVLRVGAGTDHNVALCSDGTMAAWGNNLRGRLGDGTTTNRNSPVAVSTSGVLSGKRVVAVEVGLNRTFALCSDGTLAMWGDGSLFPEAVPTAAALAGKRVVSIAVNDRRSLALCSDGTLVEDCFGEILGETPHVVLSSWLADKTVRRIACGKSHFLALCTDGTLLSWGENGSGELGNGTNEWSARPQPVDRSGVLADKTVVWLSAGDRFSFAGCSDGTAAAWGRNDSTLGNGNNMSSSLPVAIHGSGMLPVNSVPVIAAGNNHNVAAGADGSLTSWGSNGSGQLGDNTTVSRNSPVTVVRPEFLTGRKVLSADPGNNHSVAIFAVPADSKLSGLAVSSGGITPAFAPAQTHYSLSVAALVPSISVTPTVREPSSVVAVAGVTVPSGSASPLVPLPGDGPVHVVVTAEDLSTTTYVLQRVGDIHAVFSSAADVPVISQFRVATGWTANVQLGFAPSMGTSLTLIGNTGSSFIEGEFTNLTHGQKITLVHEGTGHDFVANYFGGDGNDLVLEWARRSVKAWGLNQSGQLGNNSTVNALVPVAVDGTGVLHGKTVLEVAAGATHSVVLCSDGTLVSWGKGTNQQLGRPGVTDSPLPGEIPRTGVLAGKTITSISAANLSNLAVCSDGSLVAWGTGSTGQLGNGSTAISDVPVLVNQAGVLAGKTVVSAAVGGLHCLAVCSDGSVAAWGLNTYGQLGNGTTTDSPAPVLVSMTGVLAGKKVVAVSAGFQHSLALCSDGTLAAWGSNSYYQLGLPAAQSGGLPYRSSPVLVDQGGALAGKTVVSFSQAAHSASIVLCSDGSLVSWGLEAGHNQGGLSPVNTSGALSGKTVNSVSSGGSSSIAFCSDGSVVSWGSNTYGQLGNNSVSRSNFPTAVSGGRIFAGRKPLFGAVAYHGLAVVAEPAGGYAGWEYDHSYLHDMTPTGDPDRDGIPNLLEYVLSGNPGASSTPILPVQSTDGAHFLFDFTRLASSAGDVSQYFQYSSDMVEWHDVEISPATDPRVTLEAADGQGRQAVRVIVPKVPGEKMFGRLKVRQP